MPSLEEAILFSHPDDRDRLREAIERALDHGEPYDMELRFTTALGRPLWTHTICKPIVVDGKTVKLTGTFQDITELKQAQEELDRIFSLSIDLICIADIHTATFLRINPAFTHTLGHSEKELLGRPFLDFIHPDDIEATIEVIEKGLKKGTVVVNFENRYRCRDGSYRWFNWVSHPQPDEGITYAMGRDVTDQKQAEKALRESEERYEDIVGCIPGAVYQFMPAEDGAYRFLYLSKGGGGHFRKAALGLHGVEYPPGRCLSGRPGTPYYLHCRDHPRTKVLGP